MTGLAVSAGGIGAGDKIAGIALGGVMVFAPEMTGLSVSALNGVSMGGAIPVGRKKGSWFHKVNDRFTGVSVGLVNFTRELHGVQVGLLNYAGNNPGWARLLPVVNAHL